MRHLGEVVDEVGNEVLLGRGGEPVQLHDLAFFVQHVAAPGADDQLAASIDLAEELLDSMGFPEELVLNTDKEKLTSFLLGQKTADN